MASRGKPIQHQLRSLRVLPAGQAALHALASAGHHVGQNATAFGIEGGAELSAVAIVSDRPFETEILGIKTAHIDVLSGCNGPVDASQVSALLRSLSDSGYRLITARQSDGERATAAALRSAGFDEIERLVTLSRPLAAKEGPLPECVSIAQPEDADRCAELARHTFSSDRFHEDPRLDNAAADRLKAEWARNSVWGRAERVFLTRDGPDLTGFNACVIKGETAVIDLIGVSASHRGRGLGRALTQAAISYFAGKTPNLNVGTQLTNSASLSLYRSAGFRPVSTAVTFHAHLR